MSDLRIFELRFNKIEEKEWVAHYTNIGALIFYCNETSTSLNEFDLEDEVIEVPKEKWEEYKVTNSDYDPSDPDDWEYKTFSEYMKEQGSPDIIAGTIY